MNADYTVLCSGVYHIEESDGVRITLIEGEKSALLIDTGYGKLNLTETVRRFTDKPFKVAVTHVHPDHARGCSQFDTVYMNDADAPLIDQYCDDVPFNYTPLNNGDAFDLGGRTVEAVSLPGHTAGSMGFLLREERILFAGDALNGWLWLFMDECLTISEYREMLDKALLLPFDRYVSSHHHDFLTRDVIECLKHNTDTLVHDESTHEIILDYNVYSSTCSHCGEATRIFYSKNKL